MELCTSSRGSGLEVPSVEVWYLAFLVCEIGAHFRKVERTGYVELNLYYL